MPLVRVAAWDTPFTREFVLISLFKRVRMFLYLNKLQLIPTLRLFPSVYVMVCLSLSIFSGKNTINFILSVFFSTTAYLNNFFRQSFEIIRANSLTQHCSHLMRLQKISNSQIMLDSFIPRIFFFLFIVFLLPTIYELLKLRAYHNFIILFQTPGCFWRSTLSIFMC